MKVSQLIHLLNMIGGFPCGSAGKESTYNVGDLGSIPGLERSPGEGKLPTPVFMDCIVHRVTKTRAQLSDFHFLEVKDNTIIMDMMHESSLLVVNMTAQSQIKFSNLEQ